MKARSQRTHYMGFSNRNPASTFHSETSNIIERSFNKSRSQYYPTQQKASNTAQITFGREAPKQRSYSSQLNFNQMYKESEKGHHHEFESKRLTKQQIRLQKQYEQKMYELKQPLNLSKRLNGEIQSIKEEFKGKQVNLHKLNELKHTFLRNNEKRRNLSELFGKYSSEEGKIDKQGFRKLINSYGYDVNEDEINLVFKLNQVHNSASINQDSQTLNLSQFINLMTKQNVYFKTLKLYANNQVPISTDFRFSPPDFQVFRNKFPKLKEALNIYKGESITIQTFEKVMKKLDINDLVIKESQRRNIFANFSNEKGELNVEKLLGVIATQEFQRVKKSGNQMKVTNYDNFQLNIDTNEEFIYQKNEKQDLLLQLLYPVNLKKASFVDYERHLKSAQQICLKLRKIKHQSNRNLIQEVCDENKSIKKNELYKKVEKLLQSEGYNFSKQQYKSFLAYLDFDSSNQITSQKLEKIVFEENEKERVDRLDRRRRNQSRKHQQRLNDETQQYSIKEKEIVGKMRSKSSMNWATAKKSIIRDQNVSQLKVPTKFSAWPERLYNADFSLIQAKSSFGMGMQQNERFQKDQKHSFGQDQRLRKLRIYENKIKKVAQWAEINQKRIQDKTKIQQNKQACKQYNLRLLKEQYQERCHQKELAQ